MKFKIPASLAVCADLLYKTREERYKLQKQATALEEQEGLLREHIIATLPKSKSTGISGKVATAKIELKTIVTVDNWDKLYAYIFKHKKEGAFALLQKRVSSTAVEEIWAAKKAVPGCKAMQVKVVSLTKR